VIASLRLVSHRINNTSDHLSLAALDFQFHVASTDDRGVVFDTSTLQVKYLISLEIDVADCLSAGNVGMLDMMRRAAKNL
jgi:hypothetical protein